MPVHSLLKDTLCEVHQSLLLSVLSHLQGEKDVFDQLAGLAVQTISVPIHAVDLHCDPQYIAYTCSVLRFLSRKTPCLVLSHRDTLSLAQFRHR